MYYFIYSQQQYDKQSAAYKRGGKTFIAGKVAVNGQTKLYTSITTDIDVTRKLFGDSQVVCMAERLNTIKYTKPTANATRRVI